MLKKLILLSSLTIFVVSGCSLTKRTEELKLVGGDEDEHGCLIAAGYQYCPSTEKCQRMWEEYCEEYKDQFRVFDFEDCVKVGGAILESNPLQCEYNNEKFTAGSKFSDTCGLPGANWLAEQGECEYATQDWCESNGGEYLPCESACRHEQEVEVCTEQCVPVCKFKIEAEAVYGYKDLIKLESPTPNGEISSPLMIKGEARGVWFFEGSFPIVLTNWDGLIIAEGIAIANPPAGGDWMTEDYVPFEAVLEFERPDYKNNGSLILQKDNPSDLPENDDAFEIPIFFE